MPLELVPANASPEECTHLVILLHGFMGASSDWNSVVRALQEKYTAATHTAGIVLLRPHIGAGAILSGAEKCAHIALEEVKSVIKTHTSLRYCSVVGLSFGGIYGRLMLTEMVGQGLLRPADENGGPGQGALQAVMKALRCPSRPAAQNCHPGHSALQAISFITIASPHVGIRRVRPDRGCSWAFHKILSCAGLCSRTAREVLLEDSPETPMLLRLAEDDCLSALKIFRFRSCYANVFGDVMVPFRTAAIERCNPFENRRRRSIRRLESSSSIVSEEFASAEFTPQPALQIRGSGLEQPLQDDPSKLMEGKIRNSLNQVGWEKYACVLPALPNAHNSIVGNSAICCQGQDVAAHIATQVLENARLVLDDAAQ